MCDKCQNINDRRDTPVMKLVFCWNIKHGYQTCGLLRLRRKVSEKEKVLWFSYRDSWRKWKFAFTVWKLFQTLLFPLLPTIAPSMEKIDRCRTATIILTVYFSLLLPHILLWIKQQYKYKTIHENNVTFLYDSFNKQLLWKTWCTK